MDLLPPEEFRTLTADAIMSGLLSGREPAELVEFLERRRAAYGKRRDGVIDSLRSVDTTGYLLYRMRQVGRTLVRLSERLLRTVRTRDALTYRLEQDPFGPCRLADALIRDWRIAQGNDGFVSDVQSSLLFALAEIALVVAHVGQRVHEKQEEGEPDLRPVFQTVVARLYRQCMELSSEGDVQAVRLLDYVAQVKKECERLVGQAEEGVRDAG